MKKILSLFCLGVLLAFTGTTAFAADIPQNEISIPEVTLIDGVEPGVSTFDDLMPGVTQEDVDNSFGNYAEDTSTYYGKTRGYNAKVVGVVLDVDSGAPLKGATVSTNDISIMTDVEGRFAIYNLPNGTYNWTVTAPGYCTATFDNFSVDNSAGATIFTFYVSAESEQHFDEQDYHRDEAPNAPTHPVNESDDSTNSDIELYMNRAPELKPFTVGLSNGKIVNPTRFDYLATVVSSELYAPSFYHEYGLTNNEVKELYKAQAVAASTMLEYASSVYSNHSNYTVCDTQCCQVYNPIKKTEFAITAVDELFGHGALGDTCFIQVYTGGTDYYEYIWGSFFSCCDGKTMTHRSEPALKSVICDNLYNLSETPSTQYGMCQSGAAQMAKNGSYYSSITGYYYTHTTCLQCYIEE